MPGSDEETNEVSANRVEDVAGHFHPARALELSTLADEVIGAVRSEGVVDFPDPLVYLAKQGALLDLADWTLSSDAA
jgi:hypothetical protein